MGGKKSVFPAVWIVSTWERVTVGSLSDKQKMIRQEKHRPDVKHRSDTQTVQNYKGIPFHAANGVHQVVRELLGERLKRGSKVADVGAGHGALSARLHDAGFDVTAFELDCKNWGAKEVTCHECDLNESIDSLTEHGPYQAICAV